jgi:hypothetical protein
VVRDVQVAYDEALFALRRFHEQLEDGREAATEIRLLHEYCRAAGDERGGKPSFDTVYFFLFFKEILGGLKVSCGFYLFISIYNQHNLFYFIYYFY